METPFTRQLSPWEKFLHAETTAGILLFAGAVIALVWANSPWASSYHHLWENHLAISLGSYSIDKDVHHWINDGMMAMFFFVVGLELKREIMSGELSNPRKAILPLMAAVGGMVVPALLYALFNHNGVGAGGWGIPMATDIAFALGILALLGKRVPLSLKVFLTALAIADDLGAVLVIAFFYTSEISFVNLGIGVFFMVILLVANYLGIRKSLFYGIVGIGGVWLAFLMSGVHATIAGVLAAMAIPARPKIDEIAFTNAMDKLVNHFKSIPPNDVTLLEPAQYQALHKINELTLEAATPLQRLEYNLHPWVAYLVMPLFAFANSGIELSSSVFNVTFFEGVSMGIVCGLLVGKLVGVFGSTWLMCRFELSELPSDLTWSHVFGMGLLAGIGFTMSLFITNLAFDDANLIREAKVGIFTASAISGSLGYLVLRSVLRKSAETKSEIPAES